MSLIMYYIVMVVRFLVFTFELHPFVACRFFR